MSTPNAITNKQVLARGCGFRKGGAVYVTIPSTTEFKPPYDVLPIESYLWCPAWEVNKTDIGLSNQGMIILERQDAYGNGLGVWDLWDYVGGDSYKWVPDFVEEAKVMGTSRLIPTTILRSAEFQMLDPINSHHIFVSDTGLLTYESAEILHAHRVLESGNTPQNKCPVNNWLHNEYPNPYPEPCTGLLWEAVEETPNRKKHVVRMPRGVTPPSFVYDAWSSEKPWKVSFKTAAFMSLPLNVTLEVVEDTLDRKHENAIKLLNDLDLQFPWTLMAE